MAPLQKKSDVISLQKDTLKLKGKAVPTLVKVMKSADYPDKSRWVATFLLGKIMGKKSSPYISKYLDHPNWVMRLAGLKTLLALKEVGFNKGYEKALSDNSLLVRSQALDNIVKLNIQKSAPSVWAMLYDKKNYHQSKELKKKKRTHLIKKVVRAVGDLKFEKAKAPLLSMIQKKKYEDIFNEMDYSLARILGKKSPKGSMKKKRMFWSKVGLSQKTI